MQEKFEDSADILEFAIKREQKAYDFYLQLKQKVKSKELKDTLHQFAREEMGHKKRLEAIVKKTQEYGFVKEEIQDLKIDDYLAEKSPHSDMSYKDLLVISINREQKSHLLYMDLSKSVSNPELKQIFANLAQEEASHKLRFELEYNKNILSND